MASRFSTTALMYPWWNAPFRDVRQTDNSVAFIFRRRPLATMWKGADHMTIRGTGQCGRVLTEANVKALRDIIRKHRMKIRLQQTWIQRGRFKEAGPVFVLVPSRDDPCDFDRIPYRDGMTIPTGHIFT